MKTEISSYEQQVVDFLNSTSTSLTIKFKEYGQMQWDKKEDGRNIYHIKLANKLGSYTFDFGQSINGTRNNEALSAYDVLASLEKYGYEDFEDFCSQLGYYTDSRSAEKIFKSVQKEYTKVSSLFTDEQLELLRAIE